LLHVAAPIKGEHLEVEAYQPPQHAHRHHDGAGIASHAGSAALTELADRLGWTAALSAGMAPTRRRRSAHDPGRVVRDLIVAIADGGDCLADLSVLREQPDLFGEVASLPTAWRVIAAITPERLGVLREARRRARERAWAKERRRSGSRCTSTPRWSPSTSRGNGRRLRPPRR
jgi:hypothetical protein